MDYIRSEKEKGCIFCDKPIQNDDRKTLILHQGEHTFVLMNIYPYNAGHLMVAPYAHVDNSNDLDTAERNEIMSLADSAMAILKETMNAEGFNFGANIGKSGGAGIEEHIHYHIVPRWQGDTNFMPVVGHTKVQVEGLQETYDIIKPHFDSL